MIRANLSTNIEQLGVISYVVTLMTKHNGINLSDIDKKSFLQSAIIIQVPNTSRLILGINPQESGSGEFHLSGFFDQNSKKYKVDFKIEVQLEVFINWVEQSFLHKKTKIIETSNFDKKFEQDLKSSLEFINKNLVRKIVPVTYAKYKFLCYEHPLSQIKKLSQLNGSLYGMWGIGENFLGVSPEPLFIIENGQGYSKALAGTTNNIEDNLLEDPKELEEHNLVVKDIFNKLEPTVLKISKAPARIVRFGKLSHIQTDISFDISEFSYDSLLGQLSPTAALGGYPSRSVYKNIKKLKYSSLEKDERLFGGTLGYSCENSCFSLVCIRNIYWDEKELTIHSGCGVVASSIVQKELGEVRAKRHSIANVYE